MWKICLLSKKMRSNQISHKVWGISFLYTKRFKVPRDSRKYLGFLKPLSSLKRFDAFSISQFSQKYGRFFTENLSLFENHWTVNWISNSYFQHPFLLNLQEFSTQSRTQIRIFQRVNHLQIIFNFQLFLNQIRTTSGAGSFDWFRQIPKSWPLRFVEMLFSKFHKSFYGWSNLWFDTLCCNIELNHIYCKFSRCCFQ